MKGSIIARPWRAYALSLALGLFAAANLAPAALAADSAKSPQQTASQSTIGKDTALAADSAKSSMAVPSDKYLDPRTGISLPDNPTLSGG